MMPPPLKQAEAAPDAPAEVPGTGDADVGALLPDAAFQDPAAGDRDASVVGEDAPGPTDLDLAATVPDGDGFDDDELEELNDTIDPEDLDEFEALVEHGVGDAGPANDDDAARSGGEIPMLTEVVQVPRYDTEDLPQTLSEVNWGDLGQRVRENVLERLLRRSDALLDAQLQNTLTPVLERAAEAVAHELHDALNRMIRDIVARAVTEELTRLHAEIAKRNRSIRPS